MDLEHDRGLIVHDALGLPGGPRGEADAGHRSDRVWPQPAQVLRSIRPLGNDVPVEGERAGWRVVPDDDDSWRRRKLGGQLLHHRRVVESPERRRHDGDPSAGALQDVAHLPVAHDRGYGDDGRAYADARQVQDRELPPVRELHRHPVARLDAQVEQRAGRKVHESPDLPVAEGHGPVVLVEVGYDGGAVGLLVGPAVEVVCHDRVAPRPLAPVPFDEIGRSLQHGCQGRGSPALTSSCSRR